jgi:hypothetical protein
MVAGADVHIFVFTDCKNNRFQKKLIGHAEREYVGVCPPSCRCSGASAYVIMNMLTIAYCAIAIRVY